MTRRRLVSSVFVALLFAELVLVACATSGPPSSTAPTSPPSPATVTEPASTVDSPEGLLQERCTDCHSLGRVTSARKTLAEWERSVQRMVDKGARLNDAEFAALVEYLAATYK